MTGSPERGDGGSPGPLEIPPDEMRRLGYRAVDLLVERWEHLEESPAWSGGRRSELEELLREEPPEEGRSAESVLERAASEVLERAGRIDHPRFFAFVPSSPTWPSVLADFLATGFNVFQGTWLESAGPSQIELVVLDWFRQWLGMPEGAGGLLTSGGSAANLVALVAARDRRSGAPRPVVYLSAEGHSSLERAARIAGIDPTGIARIPVDDEYRIDPAALAGRIESDRAAGRTPVCVCASAGTTNTGAVDPLETLVDLCRSEDVWLHVDAAYGGFGVLTDRGRRALRGIEGADSVTLDPHKWLFQPYEAGCVLARDVGALVDAFRILPDYLQDTELGLEEVNFADRGLQLTRAFRALKIWVSVQVFGVEAFREAIRRGIELARRAEDWIRRSTAFELMSAASLGVVCFRVRPPDGPDGQADLEQLNAAVQERMLEEGHAATSSTRLRGIYCLRLCIMNYRSRWTHVRDTLERMEAHGRDLCAP